MFTAMMMKEIASRQIFRMDHPEQPDYAVFTHEYMLARGEYTKLSGAIGENKMANNKGQN